MNVLVSGSSGMIAGHLVPELEREGFQVFRLVRRPVQDETSEIFWDPGKGEIDKKAMRDANLGAVIHLAGKGIADSRWTRENRREIYNSRVQGTVLLAQAIADLENGPHSLICASAVGIYGDRGEEELRDRSATGHGFLAELTMDWEAASQAAREAGVRVVHLRIGGVLAREGGLLGKMLPVFRLGIGGRLGNGRQYLSWIHIRDVVGAFIFALRDEEFSGPANLTAPHPVQNIEFTRELGRALHRPAFTIVPAFALYLLFGREMAEETMLASTRVLPMKLMDMGYEFNFTHIGPALRDLVGNS